MKQFMQSGGFGDRIPEQLAGWLPCIAALVTLIIMKKIQQGSAGKKTAAIVGLDAPDMDLTFKDDGAKKLREFVANSKLPTVIDFYQNF